MKKVTVTYKAPPGDAKVVEAYGATLHDGKPEEIEVDDDTLAKIQGNAHFECGEAKEVEPKAHDPKSKDDKGKDPKAHHSG